MWNANPDSQLDDDDEDTELDEYDAAEKLWELNNDK
jgi:hypothetical protein